MCLGLMLTCVPSSRKSSLVWYPKPLISFRKPALVDQKMSFPSSSSKSQVEVNAWRRWYAQWAWPGVEAVHDQLSTYVVMSVAGALTSMNSWRARLTNSMPTHDIAHPSGSPVVEYSGGPTEDRTRNLRLKPGTGPRSHDGSIQAFTYGQ